MTLQGALAMSAAAGAKFVAGGTTLIDLMKLNVERPTTLDRHQRLPLDQIEPTPDGGLKIGAMVRNSDLAHDANVQKQYPVLSQALLSGASPQLRNMATTGGNLLQRTRCYYFRDTAYACNKRDPGSGCAAIDGYQPHPRDSRDERALHRHAPFGHGRRDDGAGSDGSHSRARRASEPCRWKISISCRARRRIAKTCCSPGELITYVTLPRWPNGTRSHYLKLRDRASYEFALGFRGGRSAMQGQTLQRIRIALGGVGTKPWRSKEAEQALEGQEANEANFRAAAEAALRDAKPLHDNAFKVELAKRTLMRALKVATQPALASARTDMSLRRTRGERDEHRNRAGSYPN